MLKAPLALQKILNFNESDKYKDLLKPLHFPKLIAIKSEMTYFD